MAESNMLPWDDGSRMSRETPVRFWESAGVKFPRATHLRSGENCLNQTPSSLN
jgi:hypothetical protein